MKKIYEDINRILSEKKFVSAANKQPVSDAKFTDVRDFVPDLKTPINRRGTGGPPDGLPRKIAGKLGRGANVLALADFLGTHGELNAGEDDELKKRRASDPKYQEAERQHNKPRPVNFRDDKGIQYDTQGNPFRDPNKEAMATHSAITKKDVVPQASSISTTRRATTKRVASDNTASSNQTTANTYWTNPNQPAKPEPAKPEPAKPEPAKPEPAKPEPAKPEPAKPAWSEPAYPETKANSNKSEPPKVEPPKAEVSSVAKEYIKANVSNKQEPTSIDDKPEEKSKRVKIIKPSTTSESSLLGRLRNALVQKPALNEVVGTAGKAVELGVKYGPTVYRFGSRIFKDILKDKKSEVTVPKPAPKPEPKPEPKPQPQLPPPASAAKVERQVTSREVVRAEPKPSVVKNEKPVNVSKETRTDRQASVSKETKTDKNVKGRRVGQKNAAQDVVVRQSKTDVKSDTKTDVTTKPIIRDVVVRRDNEPAVKTDTKTEPVVKTKPTTRAVVVTNTTTDVSTKNEPNTQSKLQRVGPPPPPPPVDQKTDEREPDKNKFKHGPEPQIFKDNPPPDVVPQRSNVPPAPPAPPPPPPPKKGPSLVDPIPQYNVIVPQQKTTKDVTPECPTGECDPNLNIKAMYSRLASATSRGYKESKPKFSMEDTQMNINNKFNVSDSLYQSVMEVMTNAKKQGSVPGNQAERDLAAKHGDPDRITHGDILVARGVVKSNKPPVKEEISISKTVGKVVGSVEKGVSDMAKDFEAGREEAKKEKRLPVAMTSSPVAKAAAKASSMGESRDTPGNSYEHQCAIHVKSESFGEGRTVTTQHADPDENGNIAWYDVMFEHGIEKYVPTNELEILVSESHMHSMKKKKK